MSHSTFRLFAYGDALGRFWEEYDQHYLGRCLGKDRSDPLLGRSPGEHEGCDVIEDISQLSLSKPLRDHEPGAWTDDTAMLMALAGVIAGNHGVYDREKVLAAYRDAIANGKVDGWGKVVRTALAEGRGVVGSTRCGALMRVPAFLLHKEAFSLNAFECFRQIEEDTRLTHDSDEAVAVSFAFFDFLRHQAKVASIYSAEFSAKQAISLYLPELPKQKLLVYRIADAIDTAMSLDQSGARFMVQRVYDQRLGTGDAYKMLITSIALGIHCTRQNELGVPLAMSLSEGIRMGGDVDTRLALAAAIASFTCRQESMPEDLTQLRDYERLESLDRRVPVSYEP